MDGLGSAIMTMPMANLFVAGGLIFLAIAVLGRITGKIEPGKNGRIASAFLGCIFLVVGLFIQFGSSPSGLPQPVSQTQTARPSLQTSTPIPTPLPTLPASSRTIPSPSVEPASTPAL